MKISVVGLGKLGASMAAAFASRGLQTIGVDINKQAVDAINAGSAPVHETDLARTIAENRERLRATGSHEEAVLGSDISFVIVPTPSDERGAFSLQYAEWAFSEIGKALAKKRSYHNVVLTSTVLPGSTRSVLLPILERESSKRAGHDFGLCYSPEFIALGSIIQDFLNPDFNLIGEFDQRGGSQLAELYSTVMLNGAQAARMTLENAELTKLSINAFVTTKITFANMLGELCEQLPGGDVDVVTNALGLDSRIGRRYLSGAIGYGGPCFPRDNVALAFIAEKLGVDCGIPQVTHALNHATAAKVVTRLEKLVPKGATVAVLGLAYKPFSHVLDESQGVYIAQRLAQTGMRVLAFDPMSNQMDLSELRRSVVVMESIEECLKDAQAVLVTTPDPVFSQLTPENFQDQGAPVLVMDFWRILRAKLEDNPAIRYMATGLGDHSTVNVERLARIWEAPDSESRYVSR
jgi:UDPglucose 6-dehydrogenase